MNKVKIFCSWELDFDLYNEKKIEVYVDVVPQDKVPENTIRVVVHIEPTEILDLTHQTMIGMKKGNFNYLLTHNQFLIENCPNSMLFEFGTTWIKNYSFPEKEFSISALVGGKRMANGHILRHELWSNQQHIIKNKKFFISSHFGGIPNNFNNPILGNDKSPLFDSQFHICIENTKKPNWFTEKLIDCFQTKTVPIYWGCPNIGQWFDLNGMIIVDSLDEIINSCNNIDGELYNSKLESINKNFELSNNFINLADRLKNKIQEIIQ